MERIRIHELAKVMNTSAKRIIDKLNEIGISKSTMSFLEPDEYEKLRQHLGMQPSHKSGAQAEGSGDAASEAAKPTVSRTRTGTIGQSNTIIRRRIVAQEDDRPQRQSSAASRSTASSGLRAGYVVRNDSDVTVTKKAKTTKPEPEKKKAVEAEEVAPVVEKEVAVTPVQETAAPAEAVAATPAPAPVNEVPEAKEEVKTEKAEKAEAKEAPADKEEIIDLILDDDTPVVVETPVAAKPKTEEAKPAQKPQNNQPRYNNDRNERPQGGYQNRQDRQDRGGYQDRQGGYQGRQDRQDRGGYQDRQGGYQGRQDRQDRGGYQGRQDRQDRGGYQDRQGGYQGRQDRQDRGGYQNRQDRQGGYAARGNMGGYVPGKDDEDDRPAYLRKQQQHSRRDEPKSDGIVQKEELNAKIGEQKKEAQAREQEKNQKRENKKENAPKNNASGNKGKRNNRMDMSFVSEKKGVHEVYTDDFVLDTIGDDSNKFKRNNRNRKNGKKEPERVMQQPLIEVLTHVTLPESMTVKELAEILKKTSAEVMKKMLLMGIMANVNQVIDFGTAEIVADEFGIKATQKVVVTEEDVLFDDSEDENDPDAVTRPPVVVVMGHVDHGKTSLLDAIRSAHVVTGEAGGITQHIGAYTVNIKDRDITFLDTPGHEAFTAMRARGAQTTDIAVLVVAADDGVMPQTIESINHAKAANVSVIVAVNKIDKPGANVDKVMQELTEYGLVAEEWGGDTIFVPVSAKKHENIDTLLEMILLTADVMELKANPKKQPKGTVIEAKLDKNRGPVATVLVQRGTLRLGDSVVTGTTVGRIRAMTNDKGAAIKEAGPSIPVEILGLPEVPQAGEVFYGITDERLAKQLAEKRKDKIREEQNKAKTMVSLDDLFNQIQEGNIKEINIIVKADVQGSVEAVKQSLEKLSNEEVRVRIIHGAVGAINESDVSLAQVSNAMIIGFNVRPGANVQAAVDEAGVDMRLYTVIYSAIEDVSAAMKGMLDPTFKEVDLGKAEVRQTYKVSGVGTIAGCYVTTGKLVRNCDVRLTRDGIVVYEGKLASLKRFKDDVKEVLTSFECGLSLEKFNDIKEGDIVEAYTIEEVKRT